MKLIKVIGTRIDDVVIIEEEVIGEFDDITVSSSFNNNGKDCDPHSSFDSNYFFDKRNVLIKMKKIYESLSGH